MELVAGEGRVVSGIGCGMIVEQRVSSDEVATMLLTRHSTPATHHSLDEVRDCFQHSNGCF